MIEDNKSTAHGIVDPLTVLTLPPIHSPPSGRQQRPLRLLISPSLHSSLASSPSGPWWGRSSPSEMAGKENRDYIADVLIWRAFSCPWTWLHRWIQSPSWLTCWFRTRAWEKSQRGVSRLLWRFWGLDLQFRPRWTWWRHCSASPLHTTTRSELWTRKAWLRH